MIRPGFTWSRLATCLVLALSAAGADAANPKPQPAEPAPVIHLTWNAPFRGPGARSRMSCPCTDSTREDTLYLSLEVKRATQLVSLSGALLFEPGAGDSLDSFWFFERGGANNGALLIDFNGLSGDFCQRPWTGLARGHVGYTRAGARGRLDLSADVPRTAATTLSPLYTYCFARVRLSQRRLDLAGCKKPVSISWEGVRMMTLRGEVRVPSGAGGRVTWNAGPGGVPRDGLKLAAAVWSPLTAPPSRGAYDSPNYPREWRSDTTRQER